MSEAPRDMTSHMTSHFPEMDTLPYNERNQQDRKHIFCVHGGPYFLALLADLFAYEHYNVTTTNYVPRTFDQIEALRPDLVIVDLMFGVHSGWELLEHLTRVASTHGIPVIVTSTDQRRLDEVTDDPGRYGLTNVLTKPFDIADILNMVASLVGSAKPS